MNEVAVFIVLTDNEDEEEKKMERKMYTKQLINIRNKVKLTKNAHSHTDCIDIITTNQFQYNTLTLNVPQCLG